MPIVSTGLDEEAKKQEIGSWEKSCLLVFSNFLGVSMKGHKEEILNLMNNICERRDQIEGKAVHTTSRFKRELKKLEWDVEEKNNKGESSHKGKGILHGCQ